MKRSIINRWLFSAILVLIALGCSDDEPGPSGVTASFQYEQDETDFLKVTFTNFSINFKSLAWDFGDGGSSTEVNPVYTFAAAGTYAVKLTATGSDGVTSEKEEIIELIDPNLALKMLTGESSKSWKLIRDVSTGVYPLQVGPNDRSQIWFALGLNSPLGKRPCALNDEFIFSLDGTYQYKSNGDFWAEGGVWPSNVEETCLDSSVPANYTNKDAVDVSAWKDGIHQFTYDVEGESITLNGLGAYLGMTKAGTNDEVLVPQTSVSYKVIKLVDADVDTLIVETNLTAAGGYWRFALVHYDNPADEPAMPTLPPPPGSIDVVNFDFETGTPTWGIFGGTDFNGAGVTLTRIANPQSGGINTSGFVMQIDQVTGVQGWSGISTDLSGLIDFTNKQVFKVKVYSPAAGQVVKLKFEEVGNSGNNKEIDATTTVANGWEELSYTFLPSDANKWNRLVLFFDFQANVKNNATTYYFDSIVLQ